MIGLKAAAGDRAGAWAAALALDGKAFDQAGETTRETVGTGVASPRLRRRPGPRRREGLPGDGAARVLRGSGQRRLRPGALVAHRLRPELQAAEGLRLSFVTCVHSRCPY